MRKPSLGKKPEASSLPSGPPSSVADSGLRALKDLTRVVQRADGFPEMIAALKNGRSATVDGAWGSAAALTCRGRGFERSHDACHRDGACR